MKTKLIRNIILAGFGLACFATAHGGAMMQTKMQAKPAVKIVVKTQAQLDQAIDASVEQGAQRLLELNPNDFDHPENITNPWLPLTPGTQWIYDGHTEEDGEKIAHRIVLTVTDLVKEIGGVRSRVIFDADFSNGEMIEKELTFFAQDKLGNVWHLGQYREVHDGEGFIGGQIWTVGNPDGAKAGIMMPANPKLGDASFSEGYAPLPFNWTDRGRVYKMGQKIKVPAGNYSDVLIMDEFDASNPGVFQLKYYVRGVGNVAVGERGKNAKLREKLVLSKVHQLSAEELAKVRAVALELDQRGGMYPKSPLEPGPLTK